MYAAGGCEKRIIRIPSLTLLCVMVDLVCCLQLHGSCTTTMLVAELVWLKAVIQHLGRNFERLWPSLKLSKAFEVIDLLRYFSFRAMEVFLSIAPTAPRCFRSAPQRQTSVVEFEAFKASRSFSTIGALQLKTTKAFPLSLRRPTAPTPNIIILSEQCTGQASDGVEGAAWLVLCSIIGISLGSAVERGT